MFVTSVSQTCRLLFVAPLCVVIGLSACRDDGPRGAISLDNQDAATLVKADADTQTAEVDALPVPPDAACLQGAGVDLIAHSCQHALKGPFVSVPSVEVGEPAPSVTAPHTAYQVLMLGDGPGFSTRLQFRKKGAGTVVLFASQAIGLHVYNSKGQAVEVPFQDDVAAWCPELPLSLPIWLVDDTYSLLVSSKTSNTVTLVIEAALSVVCISERREEISVDAGTDIDAVVMCRSSGPCTSHAECCEFCHDFDHCH